MAIPIPCLTVSNAANAVVVSQLEPESGRGDGAVALGVHVGLLGHTIQGLHQIEAADGSDGGTPEERLLLVSIGLQQSDQSSNSFTIPMLVQRIIDRLEATGSQGEVDAFTTRVATYGSESGFGYNHTTMSDDAPFTTSFTTAFVRGYDMADPRIEVLRRDDVSTHHHVDAQSVTFCINLPATVSADNPVVGANRVAGVVLGMTS